MCAQYAGWRLGELTPGCFLKALAGFLRWRTQGAGVKGGGSC
jgi:hypothetical protein